MKILLFANTDWYLYNFRLPLARALRQAGAEVVLLSPPGEYSARLEADGFRWLAFPLKRKSMNPLVELGSILHLAKLYRRERPDLVHHFTIKCVLYGSLAGHLTSIPFIINSVTGMGYIFTGGSLLQRLLQTIVHILYRLSLGRTRVIFQNEEDRRVFIKNRMVKEENTELIRGSGVDVHHFTPLPEPQGTPVVLLAARLLWDKGVGEFVEAARRLKASRVDARFILIGEPFPDNPATIPANQLQLWQDEGIIEWWGWQDDMPAVLAGSNIFCLPTYREGLSKILVEAAACGRAIITTDIPGCRDVVVHGVNGLLVKVKDVDGLVQAILRLKDDADLRQRMGVAGRRMAEELFSTTRIINETLLVYARAGLGGLPS